MRKMFLAVALLVILTPSCSKNTGTTITVVKPKHHHSWFNKKKDKKVKRTKKVKVKN